MTHHHRERKKQKLNHNIVTWGWLGVLTGFEIFGRETSPGVLGMLAGIVLLIRI